MKTLMIALLALGQQRSRPKKRSGLSLGIRGKTTQSATYSFRHKTRDDVSLTYNNWEILFEAREDFEQDVFKVDTIVGDYSYIYHLGQSCDATPPETTSLAELQSWLFHGAGQERAPIEKSTLSPLEGRALRWVLQQTGPRLAETIAM